MTNFHSKNRNLISASSQKNRNSRMEREKKIKLGNKLMRPQSANART